MVINLTTKVITMTAQNALSIFSFDSTVKIRTFTINGEPWFVAIDVCNALGISNNRDALLKLDYAAVMLPKKGLSPTASANG